MARQLLPSLICQLTMKTYLLQATTCVCQFRCNTYDGPAKLLDCELSVCDKLQYTIQTVLHIMYLNSAIS